MARAAVRDRSALRVADGIHVLGLGVANVVAVAAGDGLTLVDAGASGTLGLLRARLRGLGYELGDVRRVLVTHAHPDHVGGLAALVAAGAEVWAPAAERSWVEAGGAPPGPDPATLPAWDRLLARLPMAPAAPVPVARGLAAGEALDAARAGLRTLALPGHTAGQLGYAFEREGVLVGGDVLMHALPWWHPPLRAFTSDPEAALESAATVVARDPRVLVVGHGPPAVARPGRSVADQVRGALARFPSPVAPSRRADAPRR